MLCLVVATLTSVGALVRGNDSELSRATWEIPSHAAIRAQVENWLEDAVVDDDIAAQIRGQWQEPVAVSERLSLLADAFALADEDARPLVDLCSAAKLSHVWSTFQVLSDAQKSPFEQNNLRLLYARWLAQYQLYNESLEQIGSLQPADVIAPSALLFYQSVAYHRLLQKDECLPVVERLLERESSLPRRFATLAKLIQVDIEPLEADSLDEVSRLMDNIHVRLGHGRAGQRVRSEEEDVITKLDKMIKKMEDQAQSAAAAAMGQAGDGSRSSNPMPDSMPGGTKGPGNIDAKDIGNRAGWGDLPPQERQQALQQLGREFPSHYRDVIEEYFRKLAREGAER
jgi:hypothetical protein